ncbi:MAG: hypothetical protein Q4P36_00330 [Bowdeniella nasicola]|nr:hypothetical protein [Bowdeniella nasicola]
MRRSITAVLAAGVLALSACTGSVSPEEEATETPTATESASESPTPSAEPTEEETEDTSESESPEASETSEANEAGSSGIEVVSQQGKLLLTSTSGASDPSTKHGKIVVSQGGCIGFVEIPKGGKPLPIVAPSGSTIERNGQVTIGGATHHFGAIVDLSGSVTDAGDKIPADTAERCGASQVLWLAND